MNSKTSKKYVAEINRELKKHSEPEFKEGMIRFFKEPITPIGVRTPVVRKQAAQFYREHKETLPTEDILSLSEELLKTEVMELGIFAIELLTREKKNFSKKTFSIFERFIDNYVHNWAICDLLCSNPVAYVYDKNPGLFPRVLKMARSKNLWKRRASCVIFPNIARKKDYTKEVIQIAEHLLDDKEDLIHKGCGWTLREAAKTNKKPILAFLRKNKLKMPRTMLRYSIERFTAAEKKELMAK